MAISINIKHVKVEQLKMPFLPFLALFSQVSFDIYNRCVRQVLVQTVKIGQIWGIFMSHKMVPDAYDYIKLFGLWEGKGSKFELNMTRYIHGKDFDAKFLESLVPERMKPFIIKKLPCNANRGNKK